MFRNLFRIFLVVVAVVFIRYVFMAFGRGVREASTAKPRSNRQPERASGESQGVLRRDPQCGTFVSESSAVILNIHGENVHFCSTACRDQYVKDSGQS